MMVNWVRVLKGRFLGWRIDRNLRANKKHAEKLGRLAERCTDRELQLISE